MVDISFNQTQTMNMNLASASFMAATNNSGIGGGAGLGFDDVMDPFFDNDWLQEHNLDILFDLFEEEIGSKNSYDVGSTNNPNLFGTSPVTSYLYGTSPTLANVLDLNDWLYYETPIMEASQQAPITTLTCEIKQEQQQQQLNQQNGSIQIDNNFTAPTNITGSRNSGKSSNVLDFNNKPKVNSSGHANNNCNSGRSSSSKKSSHVISSKKLASINNKLTSNISKLNLNNSLVGVDKNVIDLVDGDSNHHHHNNFMQTNYATSDDYTTNSLTSRMRIKRRTKKGQNDGTSLLAKPPLSTSNANNSNVTSKIDTASSNKIGDVAAQNTSVTGFNDVIKNGAGVMIFEPSPNVAIAHQRQMNNNKQNGIGDKISRMIHSKKQTIFKVTTSEAICIDRSKQMQNKNGMSFNNTNLLIPIHHKTLDKNPKNYATKCAIAIEHAYAFVN